MKLIIRNRDLKPLCEFCYLVEEHIFPVRALGGKFLHDALWADAMLSTQLLPELKTNCNTLTQVNIFHQSD